MVAKYERKVVKN